MISNKKIVIGIMIILLILGATYVLFRPLPLERVVSGTTNLNIGYTNFGVNYDGTATHDTTVYQLAPDSNEFKQIMQILHRFSYHRSLRSWSDNTSISEIGAGLWLNLYSGESNILLGGGKEIIVNGRIHQLGNWGSQKSLALIKEILSVIRNG